MSRFPQDFIDKVRDASNIVDVLSEHTSLKPTGSNLMGCCPLPGHNEKTASFSVSESKQVYHCFGCQRSGNIFTALKELKGYNFPESIEYLANRAGLPLPLQDAGKSDRYNKKQDRKDKLLKVNDLVCRFYHQNFNNMPHERAVRTYALSRGLGPEMVSTFKLGFGGEGWEGLVQFLEQKRVPIELAQSLGLIKQRKDKSGYYDLFRGRLMFPILNHKGECVGFGGRALTSDQMPKYINSSESEVFSKGSTLYGLFHSQKDIREAGEVVVVEGYMDYLALYKAGIKNVVATLGTALTKEHARLIKRYTKNVVVLFDGDDAGQKAAQKSNPVLLSEDLMPRGLLLPDNQDPDDFIQKKGVKALKELIRKSPSLFVLEMDRALVGYADTPADKVRVLESLSVSLESVADERLRDLFIQELSRQLSVEPVWVLKYLRQRLSQANNHHSVSPNISKQEQNLPEYGPNSVIERGGKIGLKGAQKLELFVFSLVLTGPHRLEAAWEAEVPEKLAHPGLKEMVVKAYERYRQKPNEFDKLSAYLVDCCESPSDFIRMSREEGLDNKSSEELDHMLSDGLKRLEERYVRRKTREIVAGLRHQTPEDQIKKLEQIVNMKKHIQRFNPERES